MVSKNTRGARLRLEVLEAREVPATLTGGPVQVGYGTENGERAVARADTGTTVVVWSDVTGLYARLYNSIGGALTGPIHIPGTGSGDSAPSVATTAAHRAPGRIHCDPVQWASPLGSIRSN